MSPKVVEPARCGLVGNHTGINLSLLELITSAGTLMGRPMPGAIPWMMELDGNIVISKHALSVMIVRIIKKHTFNAQTHNELKLHIYIWVNGSRRL